MSKHLKAVKAFNYLKKYCEHCSDCRACVFHVKKNNNETQKPMGCCLDVHNATHEEYAEIVANLIKKEFGV